MRVSRIVVVCLTVAVAGVGLAACGGGRDAKSSTATTAPAATTTTLTAEQQKAAEQARAAALVFVKADFPAGWTETPPEPSTPEDDKIGNELNACMGASASTGDRTSVTSNDFARGENLQVSSVVEIAKDDATYQQDIAAIKSAKAPECIKDFFTKVLAKELGATPASVELSAIPVPPHGDAIVGMRATVTVRVQRQSLNFFLDFVFMGKNRAEVVATFFSIGQPFDAALETALIDKLGGRLDAA